MVELDGVVGELWESMSIVRRDGGEEKPFGVIRSECKFLWEGGRWSGKIGVGAVLVGHGVDDLVQRHARMRLDVFVNEGRLGFCIVSYGTEDGSLQ